MPILTEITYMMIFGKPLIMYIGLITLILLASTATVGMLIMKGKTKITVKQHAWLARITLVIAALHGILGVLAYF